MDGTPSRLHMPPPACPFLVFAAASRAQRNTSVQLRHASRPVTARHGPLRPVSIGRPRRSVPPVTASIHEPSRCDVLLTLLAGQPCCLNIRVGVRRVTDGFISPSGVLQIWQHWPLLRRRIRVVKTFYTHSSSTPFASPQRLHGPGSRGLCCGSQH